ncbi:unnamed protein product [Acanthoscelides obtectus]|uniref:Uncharacterized protein n=1 Tax=Acanthoscelides obtectus TaxID=200917 RepID=A0A9P0LBL0_ACAOB|nr:unnamed protein product [Acanthoscelides obtectus]CAK1660007.1 hypothetical protein AOBTE_LOCUS21808 [Acanthoscelides obtectus]
MVCETVYDCLKDFVKVPDTQGKKLGLKQDGMFLSVVVPLMANMS